LLTERQDKRRALHNLPGRCNQSINLSIEQAGIGKQLININIIIIIIKCLTKQLTDCNQHKKQC